MKVHELQRASPALQALSGCRLPAKAAYAVAKNIKKLDLLLKDTNQKHHALILKYGTRNEENGTTSVTQENMDAFMAEAALLSEADINVAELHMIPLEMLGDAELEPGVLAMLLGWMIVDDAANDHGT